MKTELYTLFTALASAAAGIASAITAILSFRTTRTLTQNIHSEQKLLSQRQLIIPLWNYMIELNEINPDNPVEVDVIKSINALELIALCCEGEMIDEKIIMSTFQEQFTNHFEAIKACPKMPGRGKSGNELIKENKAAERFYKKIETIRLNNHSLEGIGK